MMKNTLFILLLTAISISSCAQKKLAKTETAKISYLKLTRTPCFGRCPFYSLEVYSDGTVKYFGYSFTQHQGIYQYKPGKAATAAILNKFAAYHPDTLKESYTIIISDLPGINYNYTLPNGDEKKTYNTQFGPVFLRNFATSLDEAFTPNSKWKKLADTAILKFER